MERTSREPSKQLREPLRFVFTSAALSILLLLGASISRAESAAVRVNQLGYELGSESRAYLIASGSESGAVFHVIDSEGMTSFSGGIGANLGTWGTFTVYALDFKISEARTYTIDVDGPFPATSLAFPVAVPRR